MIDIKKLKVNVIPHKYLKQIVTLQLQVGKQKADLCQINSEGILGFDLGWNTETLHALGIQTEPGYCNLQVPIMTGVTPPDDETIHAKLNDILEFVNRVQGRNV